MTKKRFTIEKIYELLPAIYRQRDFELAKKSLDNKNLQRQGISDDGHENINNERYVKGGPLKALVQVIGEQIELVENDILKLYDNWFIETCDEWIVPYIGDLLGASKLNPVSKSTQTHRAWVANTISYNRRKGTLSVLEQMASDVTGWNSKAVEFFIKLATTQYINHLRPGNLATVNVRNQKQLEMLGTPFDKTAHLADVRHIDSLRGYYNIPNIGIFLWRIHAYPVTYAPAFSVGECKFLFDQKGSSLPIYNLPVTEQNITHEAKEINLPTIIRKNAMNEALTDVASPLAKDFVYSNSFKIYVKKVKEDGPGEGGEGGENLDTVEYLVAPNDMVSCNLSDWHHIPPDGKVGIDPELGRIIFPESEKIVDVHVDYHYGFSGEVGGGFYDRTEGENYNYFQKAVNHNNPFYHYKVKKIPGSPSEPLFRNISDAIQHWKTEEHHDTRDLLIEITDSENYFESIELDIPENVAVVIRAENFKRPVIWVDKPITIGGRKGSSIIFEGLHFMIDPDEHKINNSMIKVKNGELSELKIDQCTFVPSRTQDEVYGKFLFTWEDVTSTDSQLQNLKNYLSELLGENWILEEGTILTKEVNDQNQPNSLVFSSSVDNSLSIIFQIDLQRNVAVVKKLVKTSISDGNNDGDEGGEEPAGGGGGGGNEPQSTSTFKTVGKLQIVQSIESIAFYNPRFSLIVDHGDHTESVRDNSAFLEINISHSIFGRISTLNSDASISLDNSIVDAKGSIEAVLCDNIFQSENCTIFGKVYSLILGMASNTLFTDNLIIHRRQQGCIRFSYLSLGSKPPRPYRCVFEDRS